MEKENVLIGFSINPELYLKYDGQTDLEKAPLEYYKWRIGGTSYNVARAIQKLGEESKLLALTGINDPTTATLENLLQGSKIPYKNFPILSETHIGIIPDSGRTKSTTYGKKGEILETELEKTFLEIEKETGKWRIATGVRPAEVALVKCLFNKHLGNRSLNPRIELIKNKDVFYDLLLDTDLLIINMTEYESCQVTSPSDLHQYGPSLVVVTDSENGGMFSHHKWGAERFNACKNYLTKDTKLYCTGTGDWFHGSLISKCKTLGKPFGELSLIELRDFISFAAKVAGKKVTMQGASYGPSLSDL